MPEIINVDLMFQSTLPTRAATIETAPVQESTKFQSTLPTRAATNMTIGNHAKLNVSIHAAHAGSDSLTSVSP